MNISETLGKLERDVASYKVGQHTQGDSANYYVVEYKPGWFISSNLNQWREHTIECVPYVNSEKAIFMAQLCPSQISVSGVESVGKMPTLAQSIITWTQDPHTSSQMSDVGFAVGVPKGIMIFSNVDFYIKTSYVDKSI